MRGKSARSPVQLTATATTGIETRSLRGRYSGPAGDRLPAAGEVLFAAGEALPAAGETVPATGEELPATGEADSVAGETLPATGETVPEIRLVGKNGARFVSMTKRLVTVRLLIWFVGRKGARGVAGTANAEGFVARNPGVVLAPKAEGLLEIPVLGVITTGAFVADPTTRSVPMTIERTRGLLEFAILLFGDRFNSVPGVD